ncbi:hypothetical protein Pen02_56850 [Plantactinospora endophytica]|uniref:FAD-dependent urate hydroxylase HpyO/Asp monooxygenase CreE-like FAD/NAD(P)-binding domain-containing protein n=1 Tax=Plantactinospora endophytica TaxID=673535 RepID=A0ABQ4E7Q4_9ACTN|nr:hypothetical protein Pen02_56850 [Plantactinospora endophytica]
MRSDRLSNGPRAPGDLTDWLRGSRDDRRCDELMYQPRLMFGKYLKHRLDRAVASIDPSRLTFEHWRTTAVDLDSPRCRGRAESTNRRCLGRGGCGGRPAPDRGASTCAR